MTLFRSACCRALHLKPYPPLTRIPAVAYSTVATPPSVQEKTQITFPGRRNVYEPDYLDTLKPKIPPYDLLDLQLKGYDYVVLERLQQLIHHLCNSLDISVSEGWAVRAESWRVQRFISRSSKVEAEFQLKEYKRVLQVEDLPSTKLSTLLEMLQALAPPGVTCSIVKHSEELDKERYIPDMEVKALQEQLEELGGPSKLTLQRENQSKYRLK